MKPVKILIGLAALLVVLVLGGVLVGFTMIDSLVRKGVEKGGTYALGVPTELASADVGVFGGTVALAGLRIANPEGFKGDAFLTLGDGGLAVSLGTLRQDVVEVPSLSLTNIDLHLERAGEQANYQVILDNLKRFESGDAPTPKEGEGGKRFIIRKVEIRDVAAHIQLIPLGGELSTIEVVVPEVILTDVGADNPLKLGELMNVVTQALLSTIAANANGALPEDLARELTDRLGQLDALKAQGIGVAADFGEGLEKVVGDLKDLQGQIEGIGDELEDAGDQIRGLLGGDKKKDGGG
jgi:hypothetical protein